MGGIALRQPPLSANPFSNDRLTKEYGWWLPGAKNCAFLQGIGNFCCSLAAAPLLADPIFGNFWTVLIRQCFIGSLDSWLKKCASDPPPPPTTQGKNTNIQSEQNMTLSLSLSLSLYLSIYLSIYLSLSLSLSLSLPLLSHSLSFSLSLCLTLCLSLFLSLCLSL